jgi:hypothetical protein
VDSQTPLLREEKRTRQVEPIFIPSREYTTKELFGPCLVCEQETEYRAHEHLPYIPGTKWGGNGHARAATTRWFNEICEEWLQKQFKPKRRERLLKTLRIGGRWSDDTPNPETIEIIVCPTCREECRKLREANCRRSVLEQEAKEERTKQQEARVEYHTRWKRFTVGEVNRNKRSMQFRAVLPNFRVYEIAFRWRATSGEGRGDSPPNVVGMWVDGKLVAHYFGWNLRPLEAGPDEDLIQLTDFDLGNDPEICDIFAPGFAIWIRREFQDHLCSLKPASIWRASTPETLHLDGPRLVHTVWVDGRTYAALYLDRWHTTIERVMDWALTNLELRIEEVR